MREGVTEIPRFRGWHGDGFAKVIRGILVIKCTKSLAIRLCNLASWALDSDLLMSPNDQAH